MLKEEKEEDLKERMTSTTKDCKEKINMKCFILAQSINKCFTLAFSFFKIREAYVKEDVWYDADFNVSL